MKRMFVCVLAAILLIGALPTLSFAARYTEQADKLYQLGLFKGTEQGYELDSSFTREQAAVMLIRLLGLESRLTANVENSVFSDVESGRWSEKYIMYCFEHSITKGTSATTFEPETTIPAEQFLTLLLRAMGYTTVSPENAYDAAIEYGLLNSAYVQQLLQQGIFTRDNMVYIACRSLQTKTKDGKILARVLQKNGVLTEEQADEFDISKSAEDIETILNELLK